MDLYSSWRNKDMYRNKISINHEASEVNGMDTLLTCIVSLKIK